MSKKLEQKQQRRLAEERKRAERKRAARRANLITLGIALVVIAVIVALVVVSNRKESERVGVGASEAGCGEIETVEAASRDHIDESAPVPSYNTNPPTNGDHWGAPADPGFYTVAVPPQRVIHNLEHGQIVIWYDPAASEDLKSSIETIVNREPAATVATPYEGITGDYSFYLTAWTLEPDAPEGSVGEGHLLGCAQVSETVVNDFRERFQGRSPEPITPRFNA